MTAFLTWANLKGTGEPTGITLPNRLAQEKNVKGFGAVGDGIADDRAAIQAAIDAVSGANRGVIYFPPGTYLIGSPGLVFDPGGGVAESIIFRGVGKLSKLTATFAGYILSNTASSGNSGLVIFENLWFENSSLDTASGGIKWGGDQGVAIRNCSFGNIMNGFTSVTGLFATSINDCQFVGPASGGGVGSFGIKVGTGGSFECSACDIFGFQYGIALMGGGATLHALRFENNGYAIYTGYGGDTSSGVAIIDCAGEANDEFLHLLSFNNSVVMGCNSDGHLASPYSSTNASHYGTYLVNGNGNTFISCSMADAYDTAAWYISDASQAGNIYINCNASNAGGPTTGLTTTWSINGTPKNGTTFIGCRSNTVDYAGAPNMPVATFSTLPTSPVLGTMCSITDAASASVGASVTAGSSSNKYLLWYNGTNWIRVV